LADGWLDYTATSDQTRGSAIAEERASAAHYTEGMTTSSLDRTHTTSYEGLLPYYDLEIRIRVNQSHRKWYHSIACLWSPISVL